ncbi:endonuclease III [Acetonema longum]|uniref:Endonuclease III n=1 Tax=Acetonema longum DSM 6540 TaxID=1009370 RepID=F7NQ35_9FIRM|nr:endonuclease III [Acetonema longum]EGO61794.1 endonuclease III [Acetonema longum DSM 6540]
MRTTKAMKEKILSLLAEEYRDAVTALHYSNPFEMLVAVVLSAQCTDTRVNLITARLFPRYNTPESMLALSQGQLEELIRDCGLYHAKAKNILAASQILVDRYQSQVPAAFDDLIQLPGVGRKTANVLLSQLFGQPALAVDTHVFRVANRLGLAKGDTPLAVEQGLMKAIPKEKWGQAHHWLIWHGRKVCKARQPLCGQCILAELCPSRQ